MTRTLLINADVITLAEGDPDVQESAPVAIEDGRIVSVGEHPATWHGPDDSPDDSPNALDEPPVDVVDLSGCVVMPGFWNAHTHAAMTFTRSIGDDLPLEQWFNDKIWVAESGLTEDDVYWGAMLAAAEMIRSGTVGFADHYFYMHRVADVVRAAGLKALLATAVFGQGTEVAASFEDSLAWAIDNRDSADGRVRTTLGPHSPYICPPEFLDRVANAAADAGLGVHIHVAESAEQVAVSRQKYGKSPVAHLADLGLFDVGPGATALAAHCIAIDRTDIDILADNRVTVVQCPRCHMKLGMGVTPVPDLLARGVRVALGTDGAGSNNSLDMRKEAELAALMQKLARGDATCLAGVEPLRLAATAGAHAMGFTQSGALRPGAAADLIVWDFRAPHLVPRLSTVGNLLYAAGSGDVIHTMVDGRWLMRDRALLTLDEAEILARASERAPAMVARGQTRLREYQS